MKRKTTPKIYEIHTFQKVSWQDSGYVRKHTVAANRRSQAITVASLLRGETVFKVVCLGPRLTTSERWEKSK